MHTGARWAYHEQRGCRLLVRLRPGWRFLEPHETPASMKATKLVKPGVRVVKL